MNNPYSTPSASRSVNTRPWYKRKRVWAASLVVFGLGAMGGQQSAQDEVNAAKAAAAKPRPTITVTATATVTAIPKKAAPTPTVTKTRTVKKPGPTVTVTKAARSVSGAGSSGSGSSDTGTGTGTGTCSITSNAGNCYQAGQYCRNSDHGAVTTTAGGTSIRCSYSSGGWRWTYA
ncbi:hypothetical protein ACIPSA_00720 [Streptomyces sp. NPDC086549]|uniref:hypothetical protein n=1 Tax=Streptomyces sp. NPDC086549 TaxID=3365752 RepID=UPI00380C81C9